MSRPPYLNQGGSDFGGTTVGQRVSQGNRTYNRDNTNHVTYNYYGSNSTRFEDREFSHEFPYRDQEPRGQKRKPNDDQEQVDQNRFHVLLESLRFKQIDARYENIKRAHRKTCKWLLNRPEYLDWLNPHNIQAHHGFLWVKGKPGAGKSTLMKFVLNTARTKMKNKVIISFFFNARGETLEKSTVGLYRSLLLQLLERLPRLENVFNSVLISGMNENHDWSVESLKEIFELAVQSLADSPLVIFIDALDECDEADIRDMVSFFEDLGNLAVSAGTIFQVCLASRHYPHITVSRKIELVLEGQEGHEQDIISYLDSELKIGNTKTANDIRADLKEKASGVFMWVVLVVGILQREHDHGRNHTLKQKLQEIHRDLHELFRDILTRDDENKDGLLLCIQWLLFAKEPLRPEQLYFAIRSVEDGGICRWNREEIPESVISMFILSSSKGLAEITKSKKSSTVQFIHESVRDFLFKENGLKDVWPNFSGDLQAESHQRLKQCCFDYTTAYTLFQEASAKEARTATDTIDEGFPFLRYAVNNVLHHANTAEELRISQMRFIESFPLADWIHLDNLFEEKQVRRHTPDASLLYILAERDLAHLIKCCSRGQSCFRIENERYGVPLLAAVATGSHAAVLELLKAEAKDEPSTSQLHAFCDHYSQYKHHRGSITRGFNFLKKRTLLSYLVQNGDEALVSFALASGKLNNDLEERTRDGRTALSLAASYKSPAIVQILLDSGAVLETTDNHGLTPLFHAAKTGDEATVQLLIANGANVEQTDQLGRTPLSHARSSAAVSQLLLHHAIIDKPDSSSKTPLMHAAQSASKDVVKLLIDRGADIKKLDNTGRTALFHATTKTGESNAKILLDGGVDINLVDDNGITALLYASGNGVRSDIVGLLIARGAPIDKACAMGRTPLSYAAEKIWTVDTVEVLLSRGAAVNAPDVNGRTPLSYGVCARSYLPPIPATDRHRQAIVRSLLNNGAATNLPDSNGRAPLSYAVAVPRNDDIVRLLLDHGAAVDLPDSTGRTALSYAATDSIRQLLHS
ncbi:hypothetical protein NW762_013712 [Fusarium torreyae]|uniref:Nephrocystin 3-like N-terminal domain-containing protein n=1 Tax=Fusarium torreyae TaxID=1237075 RepID=A0A9W8V751_9HYPO|nr:hypothetical protein NW762_013712 [Fusarium torreyae]